MYAALPSLPPRRTSQQNRRQIIVAHRNDDMSSAFDASAVAAPAAVAAPPPKMRLALPGAPRPAAAAAPAGDEAHACGAGCSHGAAAGHGAGPSGAPSAAPEAAPAADAPAADAVAAAPGGKGKPKPKAAKRPPKPKFGAGAEDTAAIEAAPADAEDTTSAFSGATLVVCPVVAIIQWRQEIASRLAPGALKVVTYHGPKRGSLDPTALAAADIVLTTYATIESDYRRMRAPVKARARARLALPALGAARTAACPACFGRRR